MAAVQGLDKIPDSLGYLIINEDGAVLSSGGELENDESAASKIVNLLHAAVRIPVASDRVANFKRLSVIWENMMYVVTMANHKIYVCKRRHVTTEPVNA